MTSENKMDVSCRVLEFNSPEQLESIEIRREVLRKPLGLDFKDEDLLRESDQWHIGGFVNSRLVGILILKEMKDIGPQILKMRQVAVVPELHGKGIGSVMVRFSEEWAVQNQFSMIDLHARKDVVPFYLNLGYHIEGDEFLEVGIPHLKMIKALN